MGCSNDFNIYGFTTTILNLIMDLKNTQSLIVRASSKPEDILPRLESTILDRKKQYVDKINVLLASWEHVSTYLICATSDVIDKLISFIYRHTLHMILKADWKRVNKAIKTHLMVTVTRCHRELDMRRNLNSMCVALCYNLIHIMNDPWDMKTLTDIINGKETTDEEVQKYFVSENGVLVVMRIEALVDSKCEDLALRLADTCQQFLKTEKAKESNNNAEQVNEPILATYQLDLITDLYLTLLSRCGKNSDLKSVFQDYTLKEGVNLLRRYRDRKCGFGLNNKLWKNYKKIVEIGSCVFLTTAFLQPIEEIENCNLLEALITEWLTFQNGSQLEELIKKLVLSARSSQHIYAFCQVLIKHFGVKLKSFCIELFIIALTVNMNEIETQRDKGDKEKVREKEVQLADGFLLLADLLQDDLGVCRECVLTAFSLNPTQSNLERIKSLAVACGKCPEAQPQQQEPGSNLDTGQNDPKSSSAQPSLPDDSTKKERSLDALIRIKGSSVTESLNYDVLSAPSQVLDAESLGLSAVLCDDLATVISSPRYHMLSWVQDWPELLSVCESYLESGGEMKNQTKELKFLNIDYNIFKDWPEEVDDIYCGIEKGYEQCIEPNDEYYVPTKIVTKKTDSDSSDSFVPKKKRRPRPRKNSTEVTQEPKRKRNVRKAAFKDIYPNVSDADTATQDSILNTDSLGSDGFQPQKVKKNLKTAKPVKRKIKKKEQVINAQELTNDSSIGSDMSTNEEFLNSFIDGQKNLSLLRKVSDPFVVKALRMFRRKPNHHLSSPLDLNLNNNLNSCNDLKQNVIDQKFDKNKPNILMRMETNSRIKEKLEKFMQNNDEKCMNGKNIANNLITRDNLCKTVPGLNSLDMIIPDILQPTVQIVQLPDNWNQANNAQSSEIISSLLPQQTNSATTSEQNKSNTSATSSSGTNTTASSTDATGAEVQGGSLPAQSSSSGGGSTSEQVSNPPVSGVFSQLVSTAKASQTFSRSTRVSQTSMTTPVNDGSTSEPTLVSRPNTVMTSASVNTVNTGQYELISKNASQSNKANTHSQPSVSTNIDLTKAKILAITKESLSGNSDNTQSTSNQVCVQLQASDIDFTKAKLVAFTKESLPKFSEDTRNTILTTKPVLRKQITRLDRSIEGRLLSIAETKKDKKPNPTDDNRSASSSNESDIPLQARLIACTKDSMTNSSEDVRNTNEVCIHVQASDIEFTKAKTISIPKESLPKFSEDGRTLLSTKPVLRIQVPRLEHCLEGKLISLNEATKDKKSENPSSLTTPLQVFTSDRDNQISKSRLLAYAKDFMPANFVTEDSRNSSSSPKPTSNTSLLRLQIPRIDGKIVGLGEIVKDKKPNMTIGNRGIHESSISMQTPHSSKLTSLSDNSNQKSDSTEQVGFSQVASLPKFQQAFGKTMYQTNSSSIATQSNPICDNSEVTEFAAAGHTSAASTSASPTVCTVLSKAVQTTNKEADTKPNKLNLKTINEPHFKTDNLSLKLNQSMRTVQTVVSGIQPTRIVTSQCKVQERPGLLQTSTSVIFPCKASTGTVTTGGIIHRKPVAILKTCTATEKGSQTKADNESNSKESVIHSNINALLTAALQNSSCSSSEATAITTVSSGCISKQLTIVDGDKKKPEMSVQTILPVANVHRVAIPTCLQKNRRQPVLTPTKFSRSVLQLTNMTAQTATSTPQVSVASTHRSVQSVLTSTPATTNESLISHNTISESSVSSKTLEQLREFESVLEQVTNTSQMKERSTAQPLSTNLETLSQPLLQIVSQSSTSTGTTNFTNTSNSRSPTTYHAQASKTTSVHDLHGERVSLTFIGQTPGLSSLSDEKITTRTPIVLVQNCSSLLASPAASSSSASPASSINSIATSAKLTIKTSKPTKTKSATKTNPTTTTLKVSTLQKPQQKPQEDEQTTQRIYAILDKYAEQLRNSPELKNKPAPRRRSNPPTNPSPTSKRKKSTQTKSKMSSQQASCSSSGMEMSPGSEDLRTMGSEDSSNGVSQISQVLNSPQSRLDEPSTPTGGDMSSETSESLDCKEPRVQHRVVLADSSVQNRAVIVQDNIQPTVINVDGAKVLTRKQVVVGGTTTMPLISLSNMPGSTVRQVLFPVHSEGRLVVTKVPSFKYKLLPGSPLLAFQPMCVNKQTTNVKHMKNPIVTGITTQNLTGMTTGQSAVVLPQDGKFTISSEGTLEGNISLDNTILINTTSASSISFLHRSVQSNLLSTAETATVTQPPRLVTAATATSCSIPESNRTTSAFQTSANNLLSICTSSMRQEPIQKPATVDKILETDFKTEIITDELETVQTTTDKNWGMLSVEKSPQSDFKVSHDSSVETYDFQTPSNLQNQDESFSIKTEPQEPRKVVDELKCFILKKESPKHETDDNESSDSTSSGRAKQDNQTKDRSGESRAASESSWRYNVLSKPGSPKPATTDTHTTTTDVEIDPDADANRRDNHSSPSQIRRYQRTGSDVQNTIYQMAFRRSDRLRASRKPREPADTRTVSSLDGELRLQKSLSEECEDLGVDEPSTSDLFPEAELLLDPDPSSRDSCAQLPAAVFSRSFDDSCCSSSSSPPSSRSSPKRQRLSPAATSEDSKQDGGAAWHEQEDTQRSGVPAFTYSRTRLKTKTALAKTPLDNVVGSDEDEDDDEDDEKCTTTSTTDEEMLSDFLAGDFRQARVLTPNGLQKDNKSSNSCSSSSSSSSGSSSCSGSSGLQQQRRSSLRGHVKKGCPCCNGDSSSSSQPSAAKRRTHHLHHHTQPSSTNSDSLPSRLNVIKKR